ncbi:MAG: calcium-binding protein, partial [Gammaproteobacteria bacterium]
AADTLVGTNTANTWNISGADNAGNINGAFNFTSMENLTGGNNADTFVFDNGLAVSGNINGGSAGADKLDYSNYTTAVTVNLANNTATGTGGISNIDAVDGGAAADTLVGTNTANTWNISGADNAGNINGAFNFTSMENLTGGNNTDTFVFDNGLAVSGNINGGSAGTDKLDYSNYTTAVTVDLANNMATGTGGISNIDAVDGGTAADTLVGGNTANTWNISGADNAGNINGAFNFTSMENLTGGKNADTFVFDNGLALSGMVDGGSGGTDTLNYSNYTTARNIILTASGANGFSGTESSVAGGFNNIDSVVGSASFDSITGINTEASWSINSNGLYVVGSDGLAYSSIETVTGGSRIDTFNIAGDFAGIVNGGTNDDVFNISATMSGTLNGDDGADSFYLSDNVTVGSLNGGAGSDTLVAPDVTNTWNITGTNSGTIVTSVAQSFTNVENLNGGAAVDSFTVTGDFGGTIDGGGSTDLFVVNSSMSGFLNGGAGADTFNLNANVSGGINGGADNDTFNLNADAQTINIVGGSGSDLANINSDLIVEGNTIIDLGAGQIKGPGTLASATGNFDLTAGTVTVNSITTANNITIKALDGNINLGQLRSSGSDGKISLTVQAGNIVNQNNGYIEADQLVVDLGNTGIMGSLSSPFEIQIDSSSDFGILTSNELQSRVFITDNSSTGTLRSGVSLVGVNSVLAQANAGLSAVTKELNIIDPSIFLTELNLFNVEEAGIKLPADQVAE